MDVERWDSGLERVILGLVAFALGFAILRFGAADLRDFLVVEGLTAAAALAWVARIWLVREHRLLWPPVCWGVLLFVAWAVWRTYEADLPYVARGELLRILAYATLFLVIVNNLHRQGTAQILMWVLLGVTTAMCFYSAWQYAGGRNTVWGFPRAQDYVGRGSGSFMCPNHFAGLLGLLLPLTLAMLVAGRLKPLGRVFLAYIALVLLAGLALTFSRGGWLASGLAVAGVLVALARNPDYRRPALVGLAVIALGGGLLVSRSAFMKNRIETWHDLDSGARNSRINIWKATVAMWRDHKWLGVGPAHFNERFKQYRTHWVHGEPLRAHNDYLNALADWGVAGSAVIAVPWLLLGYGVARTLRQVRRDPGSIEVKRSDRYAFVLGASGGLAALLIHAFVDFNFHIPANALVAVTWIALLAGYSRYATDDWWVSSRRPWRLPVTLLVLGLAGAILHDLSRRGPETRHLDRASLRGDGTPGQLEELQAAWAAEPGNAFTAYRIGECHRLRSFLGDAGYEEEARQALEWFERAIERHPFHPLHRFRAGMCLDWIRRHEEARPHFQKAVELDPEGRITSFYMGWHFLQCSDIQAAYDWFVKSTKQGWPPYEPAVKYLEILERRTKGSPPSAPATP